MPLYDYKCDCGEMLKDVYRTIDDRYNAPKCICNKTMIFMMPTSFGNMLKGYPYYDSVLETEITSRGHKNKVMKQLNIVERG